MSKVLQKISKMAIKFVPLSMFRTSGHPCRLINAVKNVLVVSSELKYLRGTTYIQLVISRLSLIFISSNTSFKGSCFFTAYFMRLVLHILDTFYTGTHPVSYILHHIHPIETFLNKLRILSEAICKIDCL